MSGIEVVTAEIRGAAAALREVADGVLAADPADAVGGVITALEGSATARAARRLGAAWRGRFTGWHDRAVSQVEHLGASAEGYDGTDQTSSARLDTMAHRLGGPR